MFEGQFKVVLLGEASVGKSSLVLRIVKDDFQDSIATTIGGAYFTHTITFDKSTIRLDIWDTAGEEKYQSLAPMYYRGAHAAIVVYDITKPKSFDRAKEWIRELQIQNKNQTLVILAGNKVDLPDRGVQEKVAKAYADENDLIFMETSAKSGLNVRELLFAMSTELIQRAPKLAQSPLPGSSPLQVLSLKREEEKGCCS
eukprot:TRINITY_DN494_c0_g1_i1.p1 TRINITY_DN494_c0_g1~~TRINITY_DN494_c0_g1_i1.p1  ORF type:complete len:199 (-),score=60.71 TRINITY_DN494_c0_g1_i1:424-1020(-)